MRHEVLLLIPRVFWTFFIITLPMGLFFERRQWNCGRCRRHSNPWIYFDSDSQGGRGYKCLARYNPCHCWMSWPRFLTGETRQ